MKYFLTIILSIIVSISIGQNVITLNKVKKNDKIEENKAIIFGLFIQRLGFSSGGFPQDIILKNLDTGGFYKFRVKPTYTSKKENNFCFYIKPGNYVIYNYLWTQSKWYGGMMYGEPIIKDIDVSEYINRKKEIPKEVYEDMTLRYSFTVDANEVIYIGIWHFNKGLVSFSNDKSKVVTEINSKYKKIDLSKSIDNIPN